MPIKLKCTQCGVVVNAPESAAGKRVKCGKCGTVLDVPGGAASMSAASLAPLASAVPTRKVGDELSGLRNEKSDGESFDDEDRDLDWERRRGPRRDAHEFEANTSWQLGLGVAATVLGVVALAFGVIPCCGLPFAVGFGVLGAMAGGAGVIVALVAGKRGIVFPSVGTGICLVAIAAASIWYFVVVAWFQSASQTASQNFQQMAQDMAKEMEAQAQRAAEEQKRRQEEETRKREEEANRVIKDAGFQDSKLKSQANLQKIATALLSFEKKHGFLPTARFGGPGLEGDLSWRVAILPFLNREELYQQFDLALPWSHPKNQKAALNMPDEFRSPRHITEKKRTYYQVLVGDGMFGRANASPPTSKPLPRGPAATIMVVEAGEAVDWHQPRDVDLNMHFIPNLGGLLPNRHFNAALADGKVVFVSRATWTDQQILQVLPYNSGGKPPNWPPGP